MRSKLLAVLAGVAIALAAYAQTTGGGFPSRPRFQAVGIGIAANSGVGSLKVAGTPGTPGQIQVRGDAAAPTNVAFVSFADSAGTRTGYVGDDSSGTSIALANEQANGNLALITQGTGQVLTNGVDITASSGTYTGTVTGCTTSPTMTVTYRKVGALVLLHVAAFTACTSNATAFTITGAPAAITPAVSSGLLPVTRGTNNSVTEVNGTWEVQMNSSGTLVFFRTGTSAGFTASGTKGLPNALEFHFIKS